MAFNIAALEIDAAVFEALDDSTKAFYDRNDDGKYIFGVTVGDDESTVHRVEDVQGLKSALHAERESVKQLRRKNAQMMEGAEPEELSQMRADIDALKSDNDTLRANWAKEKAAVQINNTITKFRGVSVTLAPLLREMTKVDENGVVYPVTEDGQPVVDPDTGETMSLDAFVAIMRQDEKYASAFLGAGSSGGSTPPGAGQGGTGRGAVNMNQRRGTMTPRQKVDFIREHGQQAFMALPA